MINLQGKKLVFNIFYSCYLYIVRELGLTCSLFHKTLPKSSLHIHWISVRFHEDYMLSNLSLNYNTFCLFNNTIKK